MKNVDIYNSAIALAQASVDQSNQVAFEAAMGAKAVELNLNLNEFNMFASEARNVRSKLMQFKLQDDNAAKAAAARQAVPAQSPAAAAEKK